MFLEVISVYCQAVPVAASHSTSRRGHRVLVPGERAADTVDPSSAWRIGVCTDALRLTRMSLVLLDCHLLICTLYPLALSALALPGGFVVSQLSLVVHYASDHLPLLRGVRGLGRLGLRSLRAICAFGGGLVDAVAVFLFFVFGKGGVEVCEDLLHLVERVDVADVGIVLLLLFLFGELVEPVAALGEVLATGLSAPLKNGECTHVWLSLPLSDCALFGLESMVL